MPSSTTFTALAATLLLLSHNKKASAAPSPDRYELVNSYTGADFFTGWSFWDQPDPTHGFVNYTNQQTAVDAKLAGLIYNEANREHTAYLGVDATTMEPAAGRASVRISSDQTWSEGGLFVADVRHTPQGACGSWPALWLVGPDWPNQGEIDIIEGVNDNAYNSLTLHTGPGCKSSLPQNKFLGKQVTNNCDVSSGENTGCSIRANTSTSVNKNNKQRITHATAGPAFNAQGGGVFATLWDASGVKIWMFPHASLPADLASSNTPDPSSWTQTPIAAFGGAGCDYASTFRNQQLVIDTTFCGDWAGKPEVWDQSPQCKAKAPTCQEFVSKNPEAFKDAFWDIGSVKVFQTKGQMAASGTKAIGKRAPVAAASTVDFPAALGDLLPGAEEPERGDADCAHMTGSTASTGTAAAAASSTASAGGHYGNSTNFAGLRGHAREGGRMARVEQ